MSDLVSLQAVQARHINWISTPANDALLAQYVAQASAWFERQTNRTFAAHDITDEPHALNATGMVILNESPVIEIASVTIGGEAASYVRCSGYLKITAPYSREDIVEVSYRAGFEAIPADVAGAVANLAIYWFDARTRVGVMSKSTDGQSQSFDTRQIPPEVQSTVDAWRSWSF